MSLFITLHPSLSKNLHFLQHITFAIRTSGPCVRTYKVIEFSTLFPVINAIF